MAPRRALATRNLRRVCAWLVAQHMASPVVLAAVRDERRMDALVRDLFGHWFVTYLESAVAPRYDGPALRTRVVAADPAVTSTSLAPVPAGDPGQVFVGLHFGAGELGALYAARVSGTSVSGPMESVGNPVMRDYFLRTRGDLGMELLPIAGAGAILRERIRAGRAVAIVADRVIGGVGTRVELFGAPARLPSGPAVLAVESGAPMYVLSIRRTTPGAWLGCIEQVDVASEGTRRERVQATLQAQVAAFQRHIAAAPEQWWTLLFPVWEEDERA